MKLETGLRGIPDVRVVQGSGEVEVGAVAYNSRRVEPGALFVAVPGFETDGHRFISQALKRGATAVLVQEDRRAIWEPAVSGSDVAVVAVGDTRRALAYVSAALWSYPARALRVIGITGTKGKTTTTYLTSATLEAGGYKTGLISGVEFKIGPRFAANSSQVTTPESVEVQALLAQMRDAGTTYAVVESTSHGLALHRLEHLEYDVAVFTNLSPDHLDFHPDMGHYRAAKGRLFEVLDEAADKGIGKTAVLNADDPASEYLRSRTTKARVLTYGINSAEAEVRASDVELSGSGTRFRLVTPAEKARVEIRLLGLFNVYNSLAAAAVALSQGVSLATIGEALASFRGVPGRMERIEGGQPFTVVVDFAHTPDSLRAALQALRPATSGRLVAVFGCGGDRDPRRRSGMGQAAAELADFTVLCSDNPRTEAPDAIINQIAQAMLQAGKREGDHFVRITDRRQAMRHAFEYARAGDVVLIAGKGHESYLIVGTEYLPWDDRVVAGEELRGALDAGS